jgi:hypothetical protein
MEPENMSWFKGAHHWSVTTIQAAASKPLPSRSDTILFSSLNITRPTLSLRFTDNLLKAFPKCPEFYISGPSHSFLMGAILICLYKLLDVKISQLTIN